MYIIYNCCQGKYIVVIKGLIELHAIYTNRNTYTSMQRLENESSKKCH